MPLENTENTVNKLMLYISNISENYGKLLVLISNIEQEVQSIPDTRDLLDLKEKVQKLKKILDSMEETSGKYIIEVQNLKTSIDGNVVILNEIKNYMGELNITEFETHFKEVKEIKNLIESLNITELNKSTEIIKKMNTFVLKTSKRWKWITGIVISTMIFLLTNFYKIIDSLDRFIEWIKN